MRRLVTVQGPSHAGRGAESPGWNKGLVQAQWASGQPSQVEACGCHPPLGGQRDHCWSRRSGCGSPLPRAAGDRARACIPSPPGSRRGRPSPTVFAGSLSRGDPQSSCLPSVLGGDPAESSNLQRLGGVSAAWPQATVTGPLQDTSPSHTGALSFRQHPAQLLPAVTLARPQPLRVSPASDTRVAMVCQQGTPVARDHEHQGA